MLLTYLYGLSPLERTLGILRPNITSPVTVMDKLPLSTFLLPIFNELFDVKGLCTIKSPHKIRNNTTRIINLFFREIFDKECSIPLLDTVDLLVFLFELLIYFH